MNASNRPTTRVRTAIALSIVAHLCALCLLAVLLRSREIAASGPVEERAPSVVTMIVHRDPDRRAAPPTTAASISKSTSKSIRPTSAPSIAAPSTPIAVPSPAAPSAKRAAPKAPQGVVRAMPRSPSAPRLTIALVAAPTPTPTAAPMPTPAARAPSATPTALPEAATRATAEPDAGANFGGLFSQNYPPAPAAPSDLTAIRARLSGHIGIRVDVDETGHATDVRFVPPPADETLAQDIRSALLALRYIPADCNGLHCEGTLEINF